MKRSADWEDASAFLARAKVVLNDLEAVYGDVPAADFLWDTGKFQALVQPTQYHNVESAREFRYIGRRRAKDLLAVMQGLQAGAELQIQGAKGSGKSTAVSAIAGYMLGRLKRKVVYLCAARFISSPVHVLRHALLVASGGDERLAGLDSMKEIQRCCAAQLDTLLFVVDDWDKFESFPQEQAALLDAVVSGIHILVKLSSTNSRERRIFAASDKPPPTFDFDGPYTDDELQTWIGQSSLPEYRLAALDCLTGGMPRLLRFYEEVEGDAPRFKQKIEQPYTSKLFDKFIGLQTTKEQLASALKMVTTGVRGIHLNQPVDLTCFYKDGFRYKILSPYLRTRAEYYIMEKERELQSGLEYAAIQTWAGAVRMDCLRGRNPARAGWNGKACDWRPEKLNKEKLEKVEADLISYVAACHGEEDTNDEDDLGAEQCDGVDLAQVKSEPAEFKKLGDVHQCLAEFDKFLDLQEPAKLDKKNIKQCGGVVQEIGIRWACRRWSRTDAEVYYCCPAHNPNEIQLQRLATVDLLGGVESTA
ncbi:hypothetical protein SELMODRAFT_419221 [Selaginella moellendorffii]|uniref:Uncharacterized protein n=1 Tax=Selaginella moellendorffii TaxID=88036 RepID=D8S884_SELML|nr:hypothetical protein SELMODRAFT_419221 [Selaginella moellendorffii]